MSSSSSPKLRRYIMTASVAAITATGAWYGAGLKTRQEFKQEKQTALQSSPAEKIEQLERTKARLMEHRADLQIKIDRLTVEPTGAKGDAQQQSG